MTRPRVVRDWLMMMPSFMRSPPTSEPVSEWRSLPARSTRLMEEVFVVFTPDSLFLPF